MRAFALLLLVATATCGLSAEFSYNRCARNGPLGWGKQCQTGKEQSPIDICDEKTMNPRRSIFIENYERQWMVTNTGHALKFTPQPTYNFTGTDLDLQDLAKLVGRSDDSSPGWMLAQIHCHLGRKEERGEGSEHALHGKRFPLECHAVHYNKRFGGGLSAAASSGAKDALAVVGFFFEVKDEGSPFLDLMTNAYPTDMKTLESSVDWFENINDREYYAYNGGLTTPGCNEIVTWIVIEKPMAVSNKAMEVFQAMKVRPGKSDEIISKFGSVRPLQPHNKRTIYSSSSGNTKKCDVDRKPEQCPSRSIVLDLLFLIIPVILLGFTCVYLSYTFKVNENKTRRESYVQLKQTRHEYVPPMAS